MDKGILGVLKKSGSLIEGAWCLISQISGIRRRGWVWGPSTFIRRRRRRSKRQKKKDWLWLLPFIGFGISSPKPEILSLPASRLASSSDCYPHPHLSLPNFFYFSFVKNRLWTSKRYAIILPTHIAFSFWILYHLRNVSLFSVCRKP